MKMKVITQLKLGLALSLVTIFIVAALGWRMMDDYAEGIRLAYNDQLAGAVQLAEANSAMWRLRYGLSQFMTSDAADQQAILAEEPKWYALIEDRLKVFGTPEQHHDPEERKALAELQAEFMRYREARPKFFELWQAGRHEEAIQWRALTTAPYGAATVRAFERQIDLQNRCGRDSQLSAEGDLRLARKLYFGIIAALLGLVVAGYWMGQRFLFPLKQLTQDVERAVQKALGEKLDTSASGNEINMLVESFNLMTAKFTDHAAHLQAVQAELTMQRESLEETVVTRTAELRQTVEIAENQTREIGLRNEMGELLQSCLSMEEAMTVAARFVQLLFPSAVGTLYLVGNSHVTLEEIASWNRPEGAVFPAIFNFDECWGLRRAKPYLVTDTADSILCPHLTNCCSGAASLCVPMAAQGEIFGLLHLGFPGFSDTVLAPGETPERHLHVDLAESTVAQIALAFSNLRLRDALRQQSIRDALTGLYNRRFLEEALPHELARVIRTGHPLAVFMLDVDFFKKFNDQYGHEAGDAVLRALGRTIKDNCRKGDIACRFGGEEFTVILADTDLALAREWGERLMQKVCAMEVKSGGTVLSHIAISMGLALYPEHGEDMETLIQAADRALYDAKHAGRNRLMVYGESPMQT